MNQLSSSHFVLFFCLSVGIAMGSGTAVAQQASNMVIVDDDFCTIVVAIRHGRAIYANIQKFVLFLIATNAVQVVLIFLAVAVGFIIPMSPLAILFINLATDGLSSVALSVEKGEDDLMNVPPRKAKQSILPGVRLAMMVAHGFALAVGMLVAYLLGLWWYTGHVLIDQLYVGTQVDDREILNNCQEYVNLRDWRTLTHEECTDGIARARTMIFIVIAFAELMRAYTVRSFLRPMPHRLFRNPTMVFGSIFSAGLALTVILVPGIREQFGLTNSLPYAGWLIAFGCVMTITLSDEYVKTKVRNNRRDDQRWSAMESHFRFVRDEIHSQNHQINDEIRSQTNKIHSLEREITKLTQLLLARESYSLATGGGVGFGIGNAAAAANGRSSHFQSPHTE